DDLLGFYSSFFYMNAVMGVTSYSFSLDGLPVLHDLSNNLFTGPVSMPLVLSKSFLRSPSYGFWLGGNKLEGNISSYSFDVCA
ncbi:hypothetical protein J0J30_24225, partial [Vibrio vulnificus]|nr:hypothetical protein [Vibrio vulnificus]